MDGPGAGEAGTGVARAGAGQAGTSGGTGVARDGGTVGTTFGPNVMMRRVVLIFELVDVPAGLLEPTASTGPGRPGSRPIGPSPGPTRPTVVPHLAQDNKIK